MFVNQSRARRPLSLAVVVLLAGCIVPKVSGTDFVKGAGQEASAGLRMNTMTVTIPEAMVVSNETGLRYPPSDHLVWFGDEAGDKKAQVASLLKQAAEAGALDVLQGNRPVDVDIIVRQFHAMTPRARSTSIQLGVHEIQFDISMTDPVTGEVLASEANISADLNAFSGSEAILADLRGETQKVRIQARVSEVIRKWLRADTS